MKNPLFFHVKKPVRDTGQASHIKDMQTKGLCVLDFTGTKALCADVHSLDAAVSFNLDLLDVGVPDSVGSSM